MNLTKYSKNRIMETFQYWHVEREFFEPMYNYLVYGYYPGGCFTSVLANDFLGAILRSHPGNTIEAFKHLAGWITDTVPKQAQGSYKAVEDWIKLDSDDRRTILEKHDLIFTTETESWMVLKDEPIREVVLY
jgi:hypothetical protein